LTSPRSTSLASFLEEEIAAGSFPGGSALVATADGIVEEAVAGSAAVEPRAIAGPVGAATLFDLASLTKPLCAGALAREAVASGLDLGSPPGRFFPAWKRTRFDGISLEHLLTHTSGLPAWFPLYVRGEGPAAYRKTLGEIEPEKAPGEAVVYSDLGILVFGEVIETFFAAPVDRPFAEIVAVRLGCV
jgi:CubicO group peptidase (beta-lactamase class C family)